jgi:hypothetical protein
VNAPRSDRTDYWVAARDTQGQLGAGIVLALGVVGLAAIGMLVADMPFLVAEGMVALAVVVFLLFLVLWSCPGAPLWVKVVAVIFVLNVVLNYGFANEVVGFGSVVVPVNELVLALVFPIVVVRFGARILGDGPSLIFLAAASLPLLIHLPVDLPAFQLDAARDALRNVDMFYYFVGVAVVLAAGSGEKWKLWRNQILRWTFIAESSYFVLYPFSSTLQRFSPYSFS